MHFPTWIDLKGHDSVPETVHHVLCTVDPVHDTSWHVAGGRRVKVQKLFCQYMSTSTVIILTP